MKSKLTRTVALLATSAIAAPAARAQQTVFIDRVPYVSAGQFFVALTAGILLAIGFQIVLSALTTAIGFSSLPNMVKRAENPPYPLGKKHPERSAVNEEDPKDQSDDSGSDSDSGPDFPIAKITSAFGLWTLLTASVSLFFASWLAVALGVVAAPAAAVVLGLVIWATFFTLAAVLEIKSITTLVGSLSGAVAQGIRASVGAIRSVAGKSPEQKLQEVADHTIEKITHDVSRSFRDNDFSAKIGDYIDQLSPPEIDFHAIRDELEELINDIEVEENYSFEDDEAKRHLILKTLSRQPRFSKKDLEKAKSVFGKAKSLRDIGSQGGSGSDKVKAAIDQLAPGREGEGRSWRERLESYLRKTNRDELNPEAISEDIDRMAGDPGQSRSILGNRLAQMDRDTAKSILAARGDIDEERAETIVSTVEKAISRIKSRFGSSKSEAQTLVAEGEAHASDLKGKAQSVATQAKEIPAKIQTRIENAIMEYLGRVGRPELSYNTLHHDLERILDNPKETPSVLRERLEELDRDSVVAALAAREKTSQQDAERIADKFIEARDNLMKRLHKIELAAQEKYYQTRYTLLKELEHARRVGASAAWWLLGTAVISAAAASAGALVGLALL